MRVVIEKKTDDKVGIYVNADDGPDVQGFAFDAWDIDALIGLLLLARESKQLRFSVEL